MTTNITPAFLQDTCRHYHEAFGDHCNVYFESDSSTLYVEQPEGVGMPVTKVSFRLCSVDERLAQLVETNKLHLKIVPSKFLASVDTATWQSVEGASVASK
jgi:hypothetical protein